MDAPAKSGLTSSFTDHLPLSSQSKAEGLIPPDQQQVLFMPRIDNHEPENFYVDIPDVPATGTSEGSYKNVATFHTREEAIKFARTAFDADEEGRIALISGGSLPEKSFRVAWEIDIDATSPREAAEKALRIQRDPDSHATIFSVAEKRTIVQIDLLPESDG
jgi:hypothetical protein